MLGLGDGTTPRFVLLVLTVILVAAGWGSSLRFVLDPVATGDFALGLICGAGGVAGVLALAWLLFLAHPRWIRHRHGLAGTTEQDEPVLARVTSLAYANHLPCPALLVDLRPRSVNDPSFRQGARVFGLPGRLFLAVGAGLRTVLRRAPERFDAVIAHELGHIANRDVLMTYFAVSMVATFLSVSTALLAWWSFGYLWDTPAHWAIGFGYGYDVYAMIGWDTLSIARTLGRYLPFAILVLLELALLIRAREMAADRWAANASGGVFWPRLLVAAARSETPRSPWRRISSLHPSIADRCAALAEPARGLPVDAADAIIVGAIASLLILATSDLYEMAKRAAEAHPTAWEPALWWLAAAAWLPVGGLAWALGKLLRRAVAHRRLTTPLALVGWVRHAFTVAIAGASAGAATLLSPTVVSRVDLWPNGVTASEEYALVDVLVFAGRLAVVIATTVAFAVCFLEVSAWPPRRHRQLPAAGGWTLDPSADRVLGWRGRLRILGLVDTLLVLHAYRITGALFGPPMPADAGLFGDDPLILLTEGGVLLTVAVVLVQGAQPPPARRVGSTPRPAGVDSVL